MPKIQTDRTVGVDVGLAAETGVDATVEKVTDIMEIAGYGVFGTPSVIIDGEVKSVGKIPTKEDVKSWLNK